MQLKTLGMLELPEGTFSDEKPLLLLTYLAHQRAEAWPQSEVVADLIWPRSKNAVHNLNQAVHTLYKRANAKRHIRRKSRTITTRGVTTDAGALLEACTQRDIVEIKKLYARGQFLQSINPDQYPDLYNDWILPEQKKLQAAVWRTYLDALTARPDNVAERLSEAYTLTSVLPEPDSDDFIRCVCLQRLFGDTNSPFDQLLQQEINDLGIGPLPTSDEEARERLGLPRDGLPDISHKTTLPNPKQTALIETAQTPSNIPEPSNGNRSRFAVLSLLAVLMVVVGFGLWQAGRPASGSVDGQAVSKVSTSLADKTRLDIPVAEKVFEQVPQVETQQLALLLAAEAAHSLTPVTAGKDATETLRELLLNATEPWRTQLEDNVLYLQFSPDGRWLVVAGEDPVAQVWDMQADKTEPYTLLKHEARVSKAVFSRSGNTLFTGSRDTKARLWNMNDLSEPPRSFEHEDAVISFADSPDGQWLATGTLGGKVRLWSLENPDAPPIRLDDHTEWAIALAFSPDGSLLFTGGDQRGVNLYRLSGDDAAPISDSVQLLEAGTNRFGQEQPLVISPDGKWAATGRVDAAVHLFDLSNPEAKQTILEGHDDHVQSLLFSLDGSWLASGSRDGDVRIWDMTQGGAEKYVLDGHEGWVMTLELSPDGRYLFSGSDDETVRVWDMATSPPEAKVFSDHPHQVRAIAVNQESWMATGSYLGDVLVQNLERSRQDLTQASSAELINAACKIAGRDLTQEEWKRFVGETPSRNLCF